jgi:hypothetical protein
MLAVAVADGEQVLQEQQPGMDGRMAAQAQPALQPILEAS